MFDPTVFLHKGSSRRSISLSRPIGRKWQGNDHKIHPESVGLLGDLPVGHTCPLDHLQ